MDAVRKMERILKAGTSVLLFPEGGWNNTENLLVQPLFSGPYQLAVQTGCQVVPLSAFKTDDGSRIYIRAANPIDLSHLEKDAALDTLRDAMASLMYENILHHGETVSRDDLRTHTDLRLEHMRWRRAEYLETPWTADVWEEELAFYKSRKIAYPSDVWACMDSVTVTAQNAGILAPILLQRETDQKYDFKNFMHRTWNAELSG